MNVKPTEHQRTVLLSLQFADDRTAQPGSRPTETPRINCISALYACHDDISVDIYDDVDEGALLRRFWLSLRAGDQVFAADAEEALSLLRHRSWLLDVIPGRGIDLRDVYGIQAWDTKQMWKHGYTPRHLYIATPDSPSEFRALVDEESEFIHSRD